MTRARKPPSILDVFDFRRLREVRKEKGFTAEEVAKNSTLYYPAIEHGKHCPSIPVFTEICRFLDLDPFTIAVILRLPCVTPQQWRRLKVKAKELKTTINNISREFVDVLYCETDVP